MAVTGLGAACAYGAGTEAFWRGLLSGVTALAPRGDAPPQGRLPPELAGLEASALACVVAREALDQAGPLHGVTGVVGATTAADMALGERAFAADLRGQPLPDATRHTWRQLVHRPAVAVAEAFGLLGPRSTVATACTSGTLAVGLGVDLVRTGRARRVVVVGVDVACDITTRGFASLGNVSSTVCRPFDVDRAGLTLGEAAAAVVLEPLDQAGGRALAEVEGYATAGDAWHLTAPHPDGRGARAALMQVGAEGVCHVNAHGTGTDLNDAMEAAVLATLCPDAAVSGIKGAVGHTLGAAGVLEAVATVLALGARVAPPTTGLRVPCHPGLRVRAEPVPLPAGPLVALSVGFAFGGHCAALRLSRGVA